MQIEWSRVRGCGERLQIFVMARAGVAQSDCRLKGRLCRGAENVSRCKVLPRAHAQGSKGMIADLNVPHPGVQGAIADLWATCAGGQ